MTTIKNSFTNLPETVATRTQSLCGLCCLTTQTLDIALISKPGSPINALWHISYKNFNTTVAQKNITKTYKNTNKIFRLLYV